MNTIKLDETKGTDALALLPELRPGILWSFVVNGRSDDGCPGDACYVFRIQNIPDGLLFKLREKLEYGHDWIFKTAYFLGHRFRSFGGYVEIRSERVSRYEYSLSLEDAEYPANNLVGVHALGADRASFPVGFAFTDSYEEIRGFRTRAPDNMHTKVLYVAFTPDAQPDAVKNAFAIHLNCLWNATGCSATKQLLPAVWNKERNTG